MKLYITRHSKTIWNQEYRLQGWQDSPLTKEGINDAKLLKQRVKELGINICYTSPIARAKRTAQILFDDIPIVEDNRLKELHFGDFEGKKVSEVQNDKTYQDLWKQPYPSLRLPNGESLEEAFTRIQACIHDIYKNHKDETVFLTVHGMICIFLLTIASGLSITDMVKVNQEVIRGCSLCCLEYDGSTFTIHYIGDDSHLPIITKPINYAKQ